MVQPRLPVSRQRASYLLNGDRSFGPRIYSAVLALTDSPAQVGFVGALEVAPVLILSMPAGALIDRWDRKRVMIVCDVARAIILASIPVAFVLGHLTLVQIYITALLEPTFGVFFDLAERACLPQMVPREQLPPVSSQNQAIGYTAAMLGPTLSGALYSVGRLFPFLVDAISYVASVVSLLFIQTPFQEERRAAPQKLWVEIKEGFWWLWHHPLMRL